MQGFYNHQRKVRKVYFIEADNSFQTPDRGRRLYQGKVGKEVSRKKTECGPSAQAATLVPAEGCSGSPTMKL